MTGSAYEWWWSDLGQFHRRTGYTDGVSDDKDRDLELLRAIWGKLFNRTHGPSIRNVTEDAAVRIRPEEMLTLAYPIVQTVPT